MLVRIEKVTLNVSPETGRGGGEAMLAKAENLYHSFIHMVLCILGRKEGEEEERTVQKEIGGYNAAVAKRSISNDFKVDHIRISCYYSMVVNNYRYIGTQQ